ncbi:MAG: beta-galactosidase [Planctomycetia bacterium]|nr:beta-galactosidase [Planctomycetia bacterium]
MKWTLIILMGLAFLGSAQISSAQDSRTLIEPGKTDLAANKIRLENRGCDSRVNTVNGIAFYAVQTKDTYAWPGITFYGEWNLDPFKEIAVDVENADKDRTLNLSLRADDINTNKSQYWLTKGDTLAPGERKTITLRFPNNVPAYVRSKVFGMRGLPGNIQANYNTGKASDGQKGFQRNQCRAIYVFTSKKEKPIQFNIYKIEAKAIPGQGDLDKWIHLSELEFFPMVDRFGQFKHSDWPGKVHSEKDLKENIAKEKADCDEHPRPVQWDQYGGWKNGPKLNATGHFRVEKYNGKWWFVDPEGHLFWSHGTDCVRENSSTAISDREYLYEDLPSEDSPFKVFYGKGRNAAHGYYANRSFNTYDLGGANLLRKYGKNWKEISWNIAHKRLQSWGMNTIANWSDPNIYRLRKTPFTINVNTGSPRIEGSKGFWGKFPDPFHPAFRQAVADGLNKNHKSELDDPWCLGIFVNNELSWGNDGTSLSEGALLSPKDQPAKIAFVKELKEKYKSIDALNGAWSSKYSSWDDLQINTEEAKDPEKKSKSRKEDLEAFYSQIANQYFRVIHEEIKKAAPNTLDLGCRFAWCNDRAVIESAKYVDIISFNKYLYSVADFKLPNEIDMPCIIGEFHFGALDRGMFHTGLKATKDQNDRAQKYDDYVRGALTHPLWVGTHWFKYQDQPITGRADGENYQIGLIDICDTPYPETIAVLRAIGKEMYDLRMGK